MSSETKISNKIPAINQQNQQLILHYDSLQAIIFLPLHDCTSQYMTVPCFTCLYLSMLLYRTANLNLTGASPLFLILPACTLLDPVCT
jgi:hypothetical protein